MTTETQVLGDDCKQSSVAEATPTVAVPRCIAERRVALRAEHITRQHALTSLAFRLGSCGYIGDDERDLLYRKAEEEWDDAVHIAAPDDPLRSLCGSYGRNLADLPERPDPWSGCWGCMQRADALPAASVLVAPRAERQDDE